MFAQKTTWAGIATLIAALGQAFVTKDYSAVPAAVTGAIGLVFASDH